MAKVHHERRFIFHDFYKANSRYSLTWKMPPYKGLAIIYA